MEVIVKIGKTNTMTNTWGKTKTNTGNDILYGVIRMVDLLYISYIVYRIWYVSYISRGGSDP